MSLPEPAPDAPRSAGAALWLLFLYNGLRVRAWFAFVTRGGRRRRRPDDGVLAPGTVMVWLPDAFSPDRERLLLRLLAGLGPAGGRRSDEGARPPEPRFRDRPRPEFRDEFPDGPRADLPEPARGLPRRNDRVLVLVVRPGMEDVLVSSARRLARRLAAGAPAPLVARDLYARPATLSTGDPATGRAIRFSTLFDLGRDGCNVASVPDAGRGVRIGVVDHDPDLSALSPQVSHLGTYRYHEGRGVLFEPSGANAAPRSVHGTAVTAVASAVAPAADVLTIGVADPVDDVVRTTTLTQALMEAKKQDLDVVNLSYVIPEDLPHAEASVRRRVAEAVAVLATAVDVVYGDPAAPLLVCPAGNGGDAAGGLAVPARWPSVVAVGSVIEGGSGESGWSRFRVAPCSQWGPKDGPDPVDWYVAPGGDVSGPALLEVNGIAQGGTSFAAAFMTGVVAVVLSSGPDHYPDRVAAALDWQTLQTSRASIAAGIRAADERSERLASTDRLTAQLSRDRRRGVLSRIVRLPVPEASPARQGRGLAVKL